MLPQGESGYILWAGVYGHIFRLTNRNSLINLNGLIREELECINYRLERSPILAAPIGNIT